MEYVLLLLLVVLLGSTLASGEAWSSATLVRADLRGGIEKRDEMRRARETKRNEKKRVLPCHAVQCESKVELAAPLPGLQAKTAHSLGYCCRAQGPHPSCCHAFMLSSMLPGTVASALLAECLAGTATERY